MVKKTTNQEFNDYLIVGDEKDSATWQYKIKQNGKLVPQWLDNAYTTLQEGDNNEVLTILQKVYDEANILVPTERETQENEEVTKVKSTLTQSLEINDQLITELGQKEKEIEAFTQVKESLAVVIQQKDTEIEALNTRISDLANAQLNKRKAEVYDKWMNTFKLPPEQGDTVAKMLSKFTSEDELVEMERTITSMSGTRQKQPEPVSVTQHSTQLETTMYSQQPVEQFSRGPGKIEQLWQKVEQLKKQNK